jgi:pyruvyltransferase
LTDAQDLSVYWFRRRSGLLNFGDEMSPHICAHVLGRRIHRGNRDLADIYAVGSILGHFAYRTNSFRSSVGRAVLGRKRLIIWGSGAIDNRRLFLRGSTILALRGRGSALAAGIMRDLPFGDPGLLVSEMVGSGEPNGRIAFVPHYADKDLELVSRIASDERFLLVDVEAPWQQVVGKISSCDSVMSSSLHGLVIADAFQKPRAWIELSKNLKGDGFKFRDYESAFDDRSAVPISIGDLRQTEAAIPILKDTEPRCSAAKLRQIQEDLKSALRSGMVPE